MKRTILTIFVLVLTTQLGAKEPLERSYSICLDQAGPINNSIVFGCSSQVEEDASEQIAELLLNLKAVLEETDLETLSQGQQAWEIYVKQQCNLEGRYVGSPMHAYCPMTKAIDRVNELKLLLE